MTDGEQKEKGFMDRAKNFVSEFDEEKGKLLDGAEKFNIIPTTAGLVKNTASLLKKYCLDPDAAESACVVISTASSVASLKIPDITTSEDLDDREENWKRRG